MRSVRCARTHLVHCLLLSYNFSNVHYTERKHCIRFGCSKEQSAYPGNVLFPLYWRVSIREETGDCQESLEWQELDFYRYHWLNRMVGQHCIMLPVMDTLRWWRLFYAAIHFLISTAKIMWVQMTHSCGRRIVYWFHLFVRNICFFSTLDTLHCISLRRRVVERSWKCCNIARSSLQSAQSQR